MLKTNSDTTISIEKNTKKRLVSIMNKNYKYDPFINELIDLWEKENI